MSPVTEGTRGLTAAQEGTAQWQTGVSVSLPFSPVLSPVLSPVPSPCFSPGPSPGLSELCQSLEFCLVERVKAGTAEGGRVEFVADLAVVPQLAGHAAGGGAAGQPSLAPRHAAEQQQDGLDVYCHPALCQANTGLLSWLITY